MIKKTLAILLFILIFNIYSYSEKKLHLAADVWLIGDKLDSGFNPPEELVLGIDINKDAFYRLSENEIIIKGGFFNSGFNLLNLESKNLFDKSGSSEYFLDLKVSEIIFRKSFEIEIQLNSQNSDTKNDYKAKYPERELLMYIEGKLMSSRKKLPPAKLSMKIDMPPQPRVHNPYYPIERSNPSLRSFSVIDAAKLFFGFVKKITKKRKKQRLDHIQRKKQITAIFHKRNSEGEVKEVKAVITLKEMEIEILQRVPYK